MNKKTKQYTQDGTPVDLAPGVDMAMFLETTRPKPDKAYNPVLWQFILEKITNGGTKDGIDDDFRRSFFRFAQAIPDTKVFMLNRPIVIDANFYDINHIAEPSRRTHESALTEEDVSNAEPPFPCIWVESYEEHGEIFKFPNSILKDRYGRPAKQIGFWSIRTGFQKSLSMSVVDGQDHLTVALFNESKPYSTSNQITWASMEPFLSSGWVATRELFSEDHRKKIHRKYDKFISHANRVAIINSDKALAHRASIHSGMRKYGFCWEVRGYYRRLTNPEAIGLNANGDRVVPGKTWVKPHTKGDKEKPLIVKRWKVKM